MFMPRDENKIICYSSEQIPEVWHLFRKNIKRALDRGSNYTLDEIHEGLCTSKMQLWTWDTDAMVTTIQTKDDTTFCLFLALGGEKMYEWVKYLSIVEDWARANNCTEMRIYGRIGWSKVIGYDVEYTKMVKKLCPEDHQA